MPGKVKKGQQTPRKLLALDGGGIRGVMTLEVLAKIEEELQQKLGRTNKFVLSDYFDYIAGTSTGAIIATCLSLGMRVDDIRKFYIDSGPAMFDKTNLLRRYFRNKFSDQKLSKKLQNVIAQQSGEAMATLGSKALKTYLMLVLRNATTDSPWPVSNNPLAKYNDTTRPDCNLNLPLWQLVRASTAAPTYFPPEVITFKGKDKKDYEFIFVDGGVTMYNNPAFQLFLMATLGPYKIGWPTGEDKMLLVSLGTGTAADANKNLTPEQMNIIYNASSLPSAFMFAASNEQDFLCRAFGKCLQGGQLDREVWDMKEENGQGPVNPKLFTYMRYNADLSREGLDALGLPGIEPRNVQQMDSVAHIPELQEVGRAVAKQVNIEHFNGFLQ
ncbi:MAG TPA: patatin-like phospholipase family protein [Pyrinomonadaceae bacterium]|nr:patatin-like phospholipase family protein [Pyrinomonadaceae bacterium]